MSGTASITRCSHGILPMLPFLLLAISLTFPAGLLAAQDGSIQTNPSNAAETRDPGIMPLELYEQVVVSYTEKYYWSDHPNPYLRGTTDVVDIVYRNLAFPNGYNKSSSYTTRQDSSNRITYRYWTFTYSIY